MRAAHHGRSMEEEVRQILSEAVGSQDGPTDLGAAIRGRFAPLGGVELVTPRREPVREPGGASEDDDEQPDTCRRPTNP